MTFKKHMIELLKSEVEKKRILLIDGNDKRSLEAAINHKKDNYIKPILLLEDHDEMIESQISTIVISDYKNRKEELVELYLSKRNGKETKEQAEKVVFLPNYFGMLMLELGEVEGVVGGLEFPTSQILSPAFKIIKPKPNVNVISSVMIMEKDDEHYLFSDISVIPYPTQEQLVDIAINSSNFAKQINFKEKVAFLSFSTSGSAKHELAQKVKHATEQFNKTYKPQYKALGEIQFDAALSMDIRNKKYKENGFDGKPTIFVFPSLDSGNIGYKIAQGLGGYGAIGPIITGLNKPVNDLSRGSTSNDVYNTMMITAIQAKK
ncbi:phosphotransacetylase [Mycoplasma todarodis]|uniref:Phosphate acetyltransferase n=1 Tax=Mycoplasma todarodis TaxID=1937191 RepID=A0A4R0XJ31_9MOLU|nr:phosphotransacetylase [Mycoplasma todarodis]TCG10414.1 phosphate acetyltransferase [Mycoplasma todarodis]